MRLFRALLPWIQFQLHHVFVAVELGGGASGVGAVSGLKHDNRNHQRGGKAGGEGGGICLGHRHWLLSLEAGDHPPRDRRPTCLTGSALTLGRSDFFRIPEGGTYA